MKNHNCGKDSVICRDLYQFGSECAFCVQSVIVISVCFAILALIVMCVCGV